MGAIEKERGLSARFSVTCAANFEVFQGFIKRER
jgi:hypothetical protein